MRRLTNNRHIFLRINAVTLGAVFLLILVGSIVRVAGAGMGCPDWPRCFGRYIPPSSSSALPENYQELYKEKRIAKNERLSRVLASLGYADLSEKIIHDPAVHQAHRFDVIKAWIEYVNRLIGVCIGLLVIANMISSFAYKKQSIWIPIFGVLVFLLTSFQGWVGSLVVSTNLLHGFITFHMLLALLIVAMLLWMNVKVRHVPHYSNKKLYWIVFGTFLLFIPQLVLGTEVRGVVDDLLVSTIGRVEWVGFLDNNFYIHRSYSWLILTGVMIIFHYAKRSNEAWLVNLSRWLLIMSLGAMLVGVSLIKFDFPIWMQPLHLILAVGIFTLLFYLTLRLKISK